MTAVGPGGIGKTRLALAVAAEQAGRFAGGVWYVDLVPVTDGAMVAAALAAALGLGEQPGRSAEETVLAWLATGRPCSCWTTASTSLRRRRASWPSGCWRPALV